MEVELGEALASQHSRSESTPPLTPPPQGEGDWHRALSAYRSAEAAVEAAGRVCAGELSRAEMFAAEKVFGDRSKRSTTR